MYYGPAIRPVCRIMCTPMAGERPENEALGELMSEAFVRFAHSGNPNHGGMPEWKPYTLEQRDTLVFDVNTRPEADPNPALRKLYSQLMKS